MRLDRLAEFLTFLGRAKSSRSYFPSTTLLVTESCGKNLGILVHEFRTLLHATVLNGPLLDCTRRAIERALSSGSVVLLFLGSPLSEEDQRFIRAIGSRAQSDPSLGKLVALVFSSEDFPLSFHASRSFESAIDLRSEWYECRS